MRALRCWENSTNPDAFSRALALLERMLNAKNRRNKTDAPIKQAFVSVLKTLVASHNTDKAARVREIMVLMNRCEMHPDSKIQRLIEQCSWVR